MTVVKGNPKAPFSIATTLWCRGGQGGIKYHFLSLWYDLTGIEPRSPGPLANALTLMPMSDTVKIVNKNNFSNFVDKILQANCARSFVSVGNSIPPGFLVVPD